MPEALLHLQKHLLKHAGGDRVMADVLAAIPVHGLDAVLVAVELASNPGGRVASTCRTYWPACGPWRTRSPSPPLALNEEPMANTHRYDHLRTEVSHVR
ncbi:MAG: hypothetical protein IPL58_04850 [Betaproteobacteria bacterium]|uniref:Uncharacterized protein n=1 Tax=Candidatus Proximibacter danicus TaxID=2954365 RepID=A0A9D7K0F4_9PROT|nr:hypothetical protein [Candidatus Proximibacter danicus]